MAEAEGVFRQHITRRWSATMWRRSDSIRQRVRVVNQRTDVLLRAQGRAPAGVAAEIEMDASGEYPVEGPMPMRGWDGRVEVTEFLEVTVAALPRRGIGASARLLRIFE